MLTACRGRLWFELRPAKGSGCVVGHSLCPDDDVSRTPTSETRVQTPAPKLFVNKDQSRQCWHTGAQNCESKLNNLLILFHRSYN